MNENVDNPRQNDEVDLGQLFHAIGRMFKRLFDFIGSILYHLFLVFVWFVFFLKKNAIILGLATIVGLIIGYVKFEYSEPVFQSSAILKQNYNTGDNLYSNLDYYNELVAEGDSVRLGESLNMTPSEASQISGFSVSTDFNNNEKLILYDEYRKEIDTSLVSSTDFPTYVENLKAQDFELQKILIKSAERGLFNKALNGIVNNIKSIEYFKKIQQRDLKELDRKQEILIESLRKSDSLQKVYQNVLQINPELRDNQTSITIGREDDKESSTKEYQLYLNDIALRRELVLTEREREDITEIVEIISVNQNSGTRFTKKSLMGFEINSKYYYAVLLFFAAFAILLILAFLKYLERYKDKI
ncbi:hypothetical protein SAMN03097699_2657 [Flavobacteriaceae bacterium MAR_2010_188]|nr:hypothetical protein SAMN03097699_2657 [Flavobacteriaceae bacterium MAR_2010_188]